MHCREAHVIDAVVTVNVTEHQALELPICMLQQCGVRTEFKGIAMHDCWASYWS